MATWRSMTRWCAWPRNFPLRYPLVEGQGNFGNVDGDNAAAMRYTESRLTEVAQALLEGWTRTRWISAPPMTARTKSRSVLPAAFPNLLANGSTGIAVGMATSIPPHNLGELCAALIALIENPNDPGPQPAEIRQGPGFSHRRHRGRGPGRHRRSLQDRARRLSACARAGKRKKARAASSRSSSPKFPIRCRRPS